ncbi:MAG: hypothetical protein ACPLN0_07880 [Candidatus Hydrothermia bacterium]
MKKFMVTAVLLLMVSVVSAGTSVGIGNYIPSPDTSYGILSTLNPRIVAIRFGKNIFIEPSFVTIYSHAENRTQVPGVDSFDVDFSHFGFDLKGYLPVFEFNNLGVYSFLGFGFYSKTQKTTYQQDFGGIVKGDYDKSSTFGFRVPFGIAFQYPLSRFFTLSVDLESSFYYDKTSSLERRGNTTTDLGTDSELGILLQNQVFRVMLFFGLN